MEKQHTAFQAEEEQILANNGDKDEGDGDIELNDVSWGGTGSPRISLCDGDGDYGQPLVRRDHLVELANEERRFDFREELENDDWRVPSSYFPSNSTLPPGAGARRGPYNTIKMEAVSVGARRFQVSSLATAYIASNAIEDHCDHHCCHWTQNDVIDPSKVLRARIRYGRARVKKCLAGRQEMAAKGPLGKCLNDSPTGHSFWMEDIVEFTPIEGGEVTEFSDAELSVISNDVQYLYKLLRLVTVSSKACLPRSADNPMGGYMALRYANPGALHHARWVKLCNRVLRYYVSQKEPTRELVRDVTFAIRVYIPSWFLTIKRQSFVEGPHILQQVVANLQCLAEENFFDTVEKYWHPDDAKKKERRVVSELGLMQLCLSDNAYFAHKRTYSLACCATWKGLTSA